MKSYSLNLNDRKFKLANKLKQDLYRKNKRKYEELNYLPEVLHNDIIMLLSSKDIDKFANFYSLITTIEKSINNQITKLNQLNNSHNYCQTSQNQPSSNKVLNNNNNNNNNNNENIKTLLTANNEYNNNEKLLTDNNFPIFEYNHTENSALEKSSINNNNSNLKILTVSENNITQMQMHKQNEDEWSKISRLKHQQYLDELNSKKLLQLENKQKIKENLLNQILFNKERTRAKKEEDDKLNENIKKMNNQLVDQRELMKKIENKKLMRDIEENRAKSIINNRRVKELEKRKSCMENRKFIDEINLKYKQEQEQVAQKKHSQMIILQKFIEDNKYYDVKKIQLKERDREERIECLKAMEEAAVKNDEKKLRLKNEIRDKLEKDTLQCSKIYPKSEMNKIKEDLEKKVLKDNLDYDYR